MSYLYSVHEIAATPTGQVAIAWYHGGVWVLVPGTATDVERVDRPDFIVERVDEPTPATAYTDCPECLECLETGAVPPPITCPAITLNPGASDEATLSGPYLVSVCEACDAVVHLS